MTGVSIRDLRITSNASWRKGRGMADGKENRWEVGRSRAKSTVSIVVRTRYSGYLSDIFRRVEKFGRANQ